MEKYYITLIALAILLITIIELYALDQGIDGFALSASVGAITSIVAGYTGYRRGKAHHDTSKP